MPGKMARSDPRPSVRVTRGAGSGQHLASVLQEGRENANIAAGLGFIWRISDKTSVANPRGRLGVPRAAPVFSRVKAGARAPVLIHSLRFILDRAALE